MPRGLTGFIFIICMILAFSVPGVISGVPTGVKSKC